MMKEIIEQIKQGLITPKDLVDRFNEHEIQALFEEADKPDELELIRKELAQPIPYPYC